MTPSMLRQMLAKLGITRSSGAAATLSGHFAIGQTITATLPPGVVGTLQFTRTLLASPFTKSNIANAVANAVNSLSYQIQQADVGYSIGIDASNQVTQTMGGAIQNSATEPGQPAKPVLTAMAGAVSLAWTPGADGSTPTTGNVWTDINGNTTALTTNPQVITAPAGTPYTGTVKTQNAQGFGPPSAQADPVTPLTVVVLTQSQSPYTVQASDIGKVLAPAVTAPFQIIVQENTLPVGTFKIEPTGMDYSTEVIKGGTISIKNTPTPPAGIAAAAYEIDHASNNANRMLLPGDSGTVNVTAANTVVLVGSHWRRWLNISSGSGLPDAYQTFASCAQVRGRTPQEVRGLDGVQVRVLKVGFVNAAEFLETVPVSANQFGCIVEATPGVISSRTECTFSTSTTQAKAAGDKTLFYSDENIPAAPILSKADGSSYFMTDAWMNSDGSGTGTKNGCFAGKGGGLLVDRGEWYSTSAVAGSSLRGTLTSAVPTTNQGVGNNIVGSLNRFSPAVVVGLMRDGWEAIALGPSSRHQPSNQDRPTTGGSGYCGELERACGRLGMPMLNISVANGGLNNILDNSNGTERMKLLATVTQMAIGDIQNDTNFYSSSLSNYRTLGLRALKARAVMAGKAVDGFSSTPWSTSSDGYTTIANQSRGGTAAQNQMIEDYRIQGATGLITEFRHFYDTSSITTADNGSGFRVWPVAPGARVVNDINTTVGSNIASSQEASFIPADTGYLIWIPNYLGSGATYARMTYIDATHVSLAGIQSGTAYNATTAAVVNGKAGIRAGWGTIDGAHMARHLSEHYEANVGALMA